MNVKPTVPDAGRPQRVAALLNIAAIPNTTLPATAATPKLPPYQGE